MLAYLILVCVVSAIIPFLNGAIDWEIPPTKQELILQMGRLLRRFQQTGNNDYLQAAQIAASELSKMGVMISARTQQKLLGGV